MMFVITPEEDTRPINAQGCVDLVKRILPCAGAN